MNFLVTIFIRVLIVSGVIFSTIPAVPSHAEELSYDTLYDFLEAFDDGQIESDRIKESRLALAIMPLLLNYSAEHVDEWDALPDSDLARGVGLFAKWGGSNEQVIKILKSLMPKQLEEKAVFFDELRGQLTPSLMKRVSDHFHELEVRDALAVTQDLSSRVQFLKKYGLSRIAKSFLQQYSFDEMGRIVADLWSAAAPVNASHNLADAVSFSRFIIARNDFSNSEKYELLNSIFEKAVLSSRPTEEIQALKQIIFGFLEKSRDLRINAFLKPDSFKLYHEIRLNLINSLRSIRPGDPIEARTKECEGILKLFGARKRTILELKRAMTEVKL